MHADFHELNEMAAGRLAAGTHVPSCRDCRAVLEQARRVREGLAALPEWAPPPGAWAAIRARAARVPRRPHRAIPWAAAASVVLAVAVTGLLSGRPQDAVAPAATPVGAPLAALVEENARLEALLQQLPESRTTRLGTAYTVAALEDRLALVDDRITTVTLEPSAPELAEDLWRERVTLMNSLVQVHYARALASR